MKFVNPTTFIERKDPTAKWAFRLNNDGDQSDVIMLLRTKEDLRAGQFHYISEKGYIECSDSNCEWCNRGIRQQAAVFIPVYDIARDRLFFWQRSLHFIHKLNEHFDNYSNFSEVVFKITRHGEYRSITTTFEVQPWAKNTVKSYEEIYDEWHNCIPEFYKNILVSPYEVEIEDQELEIAVTENKLTPLTCRCCGGAIDRKHMICNFCGTHYILPKLAEV